MTRAEQLRQYDALCAVHCDGQGTFVQEVADAWAVLPLNVRLQVILAPAVRDALHEIRRALPGPYRSPRHDPITDAREWVAECTWREDPEDLPDLTDAEIRSGVARHYDGGWPQFVKDGR